MSNDPRIRDQADFFRGSFAPKEPAPHAPFQVSSATSREAAQRVSESPAFSGNKLACLRAIQKYDATGGITRKQIAELHFAGKQNYVTGPVAQLIDDDGYVFEEPARDRHGSIMTRTDPKTNEQVVIPKRFEGSAILRLTPRGKAAAKGAA